MLPVQEGLKLERPRSHDRMLAAVKTKEVEPDDEPADERSSGPFAFKTSRLNVDASNAEAPASSLKVACLQSRSQMYTLEPC